MNKKLMILTAVLVAGAAVVLVMDKAKEKKGDPRLGKPVVASSEIVGVDTVQVTKGELAVNLILDGDKIWHLSDAKGFPADVSRITRLLDDLTKANVQVLAASTQDAMNEFGFDAATKIVLKTGERELLSVNLANNREGGGQYVSFGGEYKVYLINQGLSVLPDSAAWEMKTLVNVKPEMIRRIEFLPALATGRKPAAISREKAEDPIKAEAIPADAKEAGSIRSHESILAGLSFTGRVDPGNEEFKSAMASTSMVRVALFDGRIYTVKVGSVGEANKKYFLHITGEKGATTAENEGKELVVLNDLMSRFAFEVPVHIGSKFEKGADDLVDKKGS